MSWPETVALIALLLAMVSPLILIGFIEWLDHKRD